LVTVGISRPIPTGDLVSFAVTDSNPGMLSQPSTYVRAEIYYGAFALNHLVGRIMGCYMRAGVGVGLPAVEPRSVHDNAKGEIIIPFDAVGPGLNMAYIVGAFGMASLEFVRCRLVANATVANRIVGLRIVRGLLAGAEYWATTPVTAGTDRAVQWSQGNTNEVSSEGIIRAVMPQVQIGPADVINITVLNIQAGDQLSAAHMAGSPWLNC
jgi:hypothetical protein